VKATNLWAMAAIDNEPKSYHDLILLLGWNAPSKDEGGA
jgi:hypothetical protein